MRTRELQQTWTEWLSAYERLLLTLHEQTAAVTLRDVARVERLQPELDTFISQMKEVDERAANSLRAIAEALGVPAGLKTVVAKLEKAEAAQLHGLANRVTIAARNLDEVMAKNRRLIENEMTYINGTLTLIARAAVEIPIPRRPRTSQSVLMDVAA